MTTPVCWRAFVEKPNRNLDKPGGILPRSLASGREHWIYKLFTHNGLWRTTQHERVSGTPRNYSFNRPAIEWS